MAHTVVTKSGGRVKRRTVAPGEVELAVVAGLQYIAAFALLVAPPFMLAGNGTALLTLATHPSLTSVAKAVWAVVFFGAGYVCHKAIRQPSPVNRKWAWQFVIPLWTAWLGGLSFPLFIGQSTNIIILAAVAALVTQWLVTRVLVPLDSHWYSREVPIEGLRPEERASRDVGELVGGSHGGNAS